MPFEWASHCLRWCSKPKQIALKNIGPMKNDHQKNKNPSKKRPFVPQAQVALSHLPSAHADYPSRPQRKKHRCKTPQPNHKQRQKITATQSSQPAYMTKALVVWCILPCFRLHPSLVLGFIVHVKIVSFTLSRAARVGIIQEILDAEQHLLDGDGGPPAFLFVQN